MRVVLLGPQRRPTLDGVVRSLGLAGPDRPGRFATVTAGWLMTYLRKNCDHVLASKSAAHSGRGRLPTRAKSWVLPVQLAP